MKRFRSLFVQVDKSSPELPAPYIVFLDSCTFGQESGISIEIHLFHAMFGATLSDKVWS